MVGCCGTVVKSSCFHHNRMKFESHPTFLILHRKEKDEIEAENDAIFLQNNLFPLKIRGTKIT